MQALVHPQAFTHTKRLQCMLRGSENCYQLLLACLEGAGVAAPHQLADGSDAAALADLQDANEAAALQRTLEDGHKPPVGDGPDGDSDPPVSALASDDLRSVAGIVSDRAHRGSVAGKEGAPVQVGSAVAQQASSFDYSSVDASSRKRRREPG
jgi:hypothetical protein